jgi:hypothetical protein
MSAIPNTWSLAITVCVSEFIRDMFLELLANPSRASEHLISNVTPPLNLPLSLLAECRHAACVLAEAYHNPGEWIELPRGVVCGLMRYL